MAAQIRARRITATAWIILAHLVTLLLRVLGDPGFRMTPAGPENVLVRPVRQKTCRIRYQLAGVGFGPDNAGNKLIR
jgi:hypothetical protein